MKNKSYKSDKGTVVFTNKEERDRIHNELMDFMIKLEGSSIDVLSAFCIATVDIAVFCGVHKPTFLSNVCNHWEERSQMVDNFKQLVEQDIEKFKKDE